MAKFRCSYYPVRLRFEGDLSTQLEDFHHAFCPAVEKPMDTWYRCGRYLVSQKDSRRHTCLCSNLSNMQRAGLRYYLSCLEHPAAGRVVHLCLKNIPVRDMNSQVIRHLPHDRLVVAGQDNV